MARKITWNEPSDNDVTNVEINYSATQYGTYIVATTIDATSDGNAKSSSNTWVTEYEDNSGLNTYWYKIRFYDGSNYSDYSNPVTTESQTGLCTVDDIKDSIDTVGRWTDDEIYKAIKSEEELIYIETGQPVYATWSGIGKIDNTIQDLYYVGEENIYRVDRVFYGTTTKEELYLDDQYQVNEKYGMIKLITTGTYAVTLDTDKDIEMHYVPKIFSRWCCWRAIKRLLEKVDLVSSGDTSKELEVVNNRIADIERVIMNRVSLEVSSSYKNYDRYYGVNLKYLIQNHDRNRYIASTGIGGW